MVKVRIVCPCWPSAHLQQQQQQHARAGRRAPISSPNTVLPGSLAGPGCGKFVSFTMFLFVITTYMVLSLDTLMLMDAGTQQQAEQQQQQLPRRNLAPPALPAHELTRVKLIVLEEDVVAPSKPASVAAASTATQAEEEVEEDFASSLRSVGLALQDVPSTAAAAAAEPPLVTAFEVGDVDETEDSDSSNEDDSNQGLDFTTSALTWKRLHLCKDGSSAELGINIPHWLARHRKSAIDKDGYTKTPTEARMRHLKSSLQALNKLGDFKQAVAEASRADYSLCRMDLDAEGGRVVVWLPKVKGDALVFVRFGSEVRNLGVEIPHSTYDHTLAQGLYVFAETRARALVLSTSHRCSRALANACTGNDNEPIRNVCASSAVTAVGAGTATAANRNSDVAHAVQTMFHSAHEQLAEDFPTLVFASLHSTKAAEFVISDGTSLPQGPDSAVWRLARKLGSSLPLTTMSVCNEGGGGGAGEQENVRPVRPEHSFICGATNVQGRHLNGAAADACRAKIPRSGQGLVSSARFLHIEQPVSFVLPAPSSTASAETKPVLTKELSDALVFAIAGQVTIPHDPATSS